MAEAMKHLSIHRVPIALDDGGSAMDSGHASSYFRHPTIEDILQAR